MTTMAYIVSVEAPEQKIEVNANNSKVRTKCWRRFNHTSNTAYIKFTSTQNISRGACNMVQCFHRCRVIEITMQYSSMRVEILPMHAC